MSDIYKYNNVKRMIMSGLLLCLLCLLPSEVYAVYGKYGISDQYGTWQKKYLDKIDNNELSARNLSYDEAFSGSGKQNDPYLIENEWDLCRLSDWVNGGFGTNTGGINFNGVYFKLTTDIDLSGAIWYPIGVKPDACFAGIFDGNNHTISNIRIVVVDSETNTEYHYGLFGSMKGVIRNLNLVNDNIAIESTSDNHSTYFVAGLLCGSMGCAPGEGCYGAVYGCTIAGKIEGTNKNTNGDYLASYIGGVTGKCDNPVSIYRCHTDVSISVSDVQAVGGITGMTSFGITGEENNLNTPLISYIFDCTANVNINVSSSTYNKCYSGGICGISWSGILGCASTGMITGQPKNTTDEYCIGGLVGWNNSNLMNSVSMVQLKGGNMLGGIIGLCSNNYEFFVGNVANCVYSGHIDGKNATEAHGIVGYQQNSRNPINCLFLGTMQCKTNNNPLSNDATTDCYYDINMYDEGGNWSTARTLSQLTNYKGTWDTGFTTSLNYNVAWQSLKQQSPQFKEIFIDQWYDWNFPEGLYPQVKVTDYNITSAMTDIHGMDDERLRDWVIQKARYKWDNEVVLTTPSLFPKYAWLASVPVNILNESFRTEFVDQPFSLASKTSGDMTANYSLSAEDFITASGETAMPKDNVEGDMMLTIASEGISKQLRLHVNTSHTWDGTMFKIYDGGTGKDGNPYLIHNARQLIHALTNNEEDEHYKLTKDIWFNDNLLTNEGEPKSSCSKWDHQSRRDLLNWKGHLDGDGHLIRGLFSTNAYGLVEKIQSDATIKNTGFVDCLVWSPETETGTISIGGNPFGFLAPVISSTASVSNCLFYGVCNDRRTNGTTANCSAFVHTVEGSSSSTTTIVEDCVVAVVAKSVNDISEDQLLFSNLTGDTPDHDAAQRVLVLNNCGVSDIMASSHFTLTQCYSPLGYLSLYNSDPTSSNDNVKSVAAMTDGTFFTGDGFNRWTHQDGRFPMLASFAGTAYGKLLTLPIHTDNDNRLSKMNYLLDFQPGTATWQTTDINVLQVDKDIRVLEPKLEGRGVYLVRNMDDAKIITPITTAASVTKGIRFEDEEAKAFCLAHYDTDNNGEIALSELKIVTLNQFQADMNKNDNDPNDNDGDLIEKFPEFRYFAAIDDLGTSFQEKDKLQTLNFSSKITELSDNDFMGTTSMTDFSVPVSVSSVSGLAFYQSGLENYTVEPGHATYAAENGLLMSKDKDVLYSYPYGREVSSITIPDNVKTIGSYAVYKMPEVDTIYIDAKDYDYETVVQLQENAFTAANGKSIKYYIEDGTQDYYDDGDDEGSSNAPRRRASQTVTDGNGKGHLLSKYQESEFWVGKDLSRFINLTVSDKSKDSNGNYWATLYCGFDTELPEWMTAYIVDKEKTSTTSTTLVLRNIGNKVRMLTPVVIKATKPGTIKLEPTKDTKRFKRYAAYENLLDGVGRNGFDVYQSDANDGGCLTLGNNSKGEVGFFIYKGKDKIPPYRSYISVNKVGNAKSLLLDVDEETSKVNSLKASKVDDVYYNLKGERIAHPNKGIYIVNGKKIIR